MKDFDFIAFPHAKYRSIRVEIIVLLANINRSRNKAKGSKGNAVHGDEIGNGAIEDLDKLQFVGHSVNRQSSAVPGIG